MAGIKEEKKIYLVGIYCRLSKDDGTDNESASIATQKSILADYVKKQGWHLAKTYVDDGYSGTNFQRPSFQNMIKDIESGLINCVITKDLSRLGRNYLDCGLYLEVFFPEHNVRYIAVNDGVDTLNKSAMDITPFRNILNEMYSADVSVKIKSAYRARFQQGKFMGTTAPYGYVKDPADHNHLLIDDKVAHVVREIFDLALAGNGIAKIRKHINKQHILRPAAYAVTQGAIGYERHFEDNEENRYIWSENSIRGILRSPIYAGNLAGYKRIAANMKSKKRPSKLPEEWEVIPDTHEGIVTQEEFDTVQQLMTSRRREQNAGGFENIFSGVIKCADCGYAMRAASANRRKRPDIIDCVQYTCNNYGRYGNVMCTAHSIEARDLFNAVLADINRFADMAVNDEKAVRAIEKRLTETDQSRARALEKEQRKLNKRLAELDRLFSSLYEDKVMERITERNFEMMSGKYQKEQLEIEARLREVTETLNDSYEKSQGVRDFLSLIRNYQGLKELDATIINALIDKILVSEREKLTDGTVRQEIKIYYKFIGFVGELHITPTKRWTALKPKNCTVCGVEYVPRSAISKYCPECRKRIRKVQGTETKRRSRERNRQACIELSAKNDRLIKIVGAEFTQDDYGDDLLRIYYDYTNTDDTANGHYLNTALQFVSITQDGNECETYMADSDDYFIVPEDLNNTNYVQPGCTNRNTILIACDPNGGNVKVSCFLMIGGWVYNANEVEPFEFEIDTKDLMGAPEPFVLPAITNPTYTSGMSASGKYDYPLDSEISINDIELTKDYDGRDVIRVNLTVTNNGEEELTPALICLLELYQDGVSLPWVNATWDMDSDAVTDRDIAYEEDLYPGETVECSALFYPRTQSPVEAVIENVNAELCLGARFDLKPLYEEANAQAEVAAEAAAQAAAAASAADKAIMAAMVGAWDRTNSWPDHITFHADGTGVHDMTGDLFDFSYYVSEGVVYLTYDDGEETDYEVTVNGNDMILFNAFYQEEQTFARTGTAETEEPAETEPAQTEPAATEAAAMDWATFLIGTWEDQESGYYETFTFRADGTGMYSYYDGGLMEFPFTYEICDDDSVDIFYDDGDAGGFWMEAADENTLLISNSAVSDMPLIRE